MSGPSQPEATRARKLLGVRLTPDAIARIRGAAADRGVTVAELVERWATRLR